MALPTCIKCGGHSFETQVHSPIRSRYKVIFIQCASCGGVVGTMDYYNIPDSLEKIANKIGLKLYG